MDPLLELTRPRCVVSQGTWHLKIPEPAAIAFSLCFSSWKKCWNKSLHKHLKPEAGMTDCQQAFLESKSCQGVQLPQHREAGDGLWGQAGRGVHALNSQKQWTHHKDRHGRYPLIRESWNILNWKGPTRVIKPNSWLCTATPTIPPWALSKCPLNSRSFILLQ